MTQVIYLDVLFCLNLFVNYFIILSTAKLLRMEVSKLRVCLGAAVGSLASFVILLPSLGIIGNLFIKIAVSLITIFTVFGVKSLKFFLKSCAAFLLLSFSFAGIMTAILTFCSPKGMVMNNSVLYINISPLLVILLSVVCYIVMSVIERLTSHEKPKEIHCIVTVEVDGKHVNLNAITDTGNSLREVFSDFPVMVVEYESVSLLLPENLRESFKAVGTNQLGVWQARYRVVPYSAVSGDGVLPAFKPDYVIIKRDSKSIKKKNVYVAVSEKKLSSGEFNAILNPEIAN